MIVNSLNKNKCQLPLSPTSTPSNTGYMQLTDEPPSMRKPSQSYVDNYIARRGDVIPTASGRMATATPLATTTSGGDMPSRSRQHAHTALC